MNPIKFSDFVDVQDWEKVKTTFKQLQEIIKETSEMSMKNLQKVDFGSFKGVKDAITDINKLDESFNSLVTTEKRLSEITKAQTEASKQQTEAEKRATEMAKQATEDQKKYTQSIRAKTEEEKKNTQIKTTLVQSEKAKTEATKQNLNETRKNILIQEAERQAKLTEKQTQKTIGAYDLLSRELNELSKEYRNLAAAEQHETDSGRAMLARIQTLDTQLKKIDASTGRFTRSVGNYQNQFYSFNNVLKEMPNFAISATIGIQSLSNNLPMLAEELRNARNQGQSWGTVLTGLGKNIFGVTGIAVIFTTALTMLPKILQKLKGETEKTTQALQQLREELAKDLTGIEILLDVTKLYTDVSKIRKQTIEDINEQYGKYLPNLLTEKDTQEDIAKAYWLVVDAIYAKMAAKRQEIEVEAIFNKMVDQQDKKIKELAKGNIKEQNELQKQILFRVKFYEDILKSSKKTSDQLIKDQEKISLKNKSTATSIQNRLIPFKALSQESKKVNKEYQDILKSMNDYLDKSTKAEINILAIKQAKTKQEIEKIVEYYKGYAQILEYTHKKEKSGIGAAGKGIEQLNYLEELRQKIEDLKKEQESLSDVFKKGSEIQKKTASERSIQIEKEITDNEILIQSIELRLSLINELDAKEQDLTRSKQEQRDLSNLLESIDSEETKNIIESKKQEIQLLEDEIKLLKERLGIISPKEQKAEKLEKGQKATDLIEGEFEYRREVLREQYLKDFLTDEEYNKEKINLEIEYWTAKRDAQIEGTTEYIEYNNKVLELLKKQEESFQKEIGKTLGLGLEIIKSYMDKRNEIIRSRLDEEMRISEQHYARLTALAAMQSEDAKDNLAYEEREQAKLALQKQRQLEKERRQELIFTILKTYSSKLESGDKNALVNTIKDTAILTAFAKNIPAFYEGTEDTGTGGNVDNKGGFNAILHPKERILSAVQNKPLLDAGISNWELVNTALIGKKAIEGQISIDEYRYNKEIINRLNSLEKTIENKPVYQGSDYDSLSHSVTKIIENSTYLTRTHKRLSKLA